MPEAELAAAALAAAAGAAALGAKAFRGRLGQAAAAEVRRDLRVPPASKETRDFRAPERKVPKEFLGLRDFPDRKASKEILEVRAIKAFKETAAQSRSHSWLQTGRPLRRVTPSAAKRTADSTMTVER